MLQQDRQVDRLGADLGNIAAARQCVQPLKGDLARRFSRNRPGRGGGNLRRLKDGRRSLDRRHLLVEPHRGRQWRTGMIEFLRLFRFVDTDRRSEIPGRARFSRHAGISGPASRQGEQADRQDEQAAGESDQAGRTGRSLVGAIAPGFDLPGEPRETGGVGRRDPESLSIALG